MKKPKNRLKGDGCITEAYEDIGRQCGLSLGSIKNLQLEIQVFKREKTQRDLQISKRDLAAYENGLIEFAAGRHLASILKQAPSAWTKIEGEDWLAQLLETRIIRVHRIERCRTGKKWFTVRDALRYPTAEIISENSGWHHRVERTVKTLLPEFRLSYRAATGSDVFSFRKTKK